MVVSAEPHKPSKNVLNIYDLKNKLIVYSISVGDVAHILCEWGTIIVLSQDQPILCIAEKDMGSKLDMLFRKSLYTVAINLVSIFQDSSFCTSIEQLSCHLHMFSYIVR